MSTATGHRHTSPEELDDLRVYLNELADDTANPDDPELTDEEIAMLERRDREMDGHCHGDGATWCSPGSRIWSATEPRGAS